MADDAPAHPLPPTDVLDILKSVRLIQEESGWGTVTLVIKNGKLDEIATEITRKIQVERKAPR